MLQGAIISIIRHALTAGGAYLVTKGIGDADTINTIIGGIMAAVALGWSVIAKSPNNNLK